MEKVFRGSKYFEDEVNSLRHAVSDYLTIGICVTRNDRSPTLLRQSSVVEAMCQEIAKQRGIPFVTVYWYMPDSVIVTIPNLVKTQPLYATAMLIAAPWEGVLNREPVQLEMQSNKVKVYYHGAQGMEALRGWMNATQNESKLRFILGLPPKVSPTINSVHRSG